MNRATETGSRFPNMIVQASAGSGKTFALTNRYLKLLAHGNSCDSILATTFTRKAAGEILDRIMQRLTNAARHPALAAELGTQLGEDLTPERVIGLLRHLAENLHRLQISTLDSFFSQLARAFSFELGLPVDWKIAETGQLNALTEVAVRNLLHASNTRELLYLISRNDAERKIADLMIQEIGKYADVYRDSTAEAWVHPSPGQRNLGALLRAIRDSYPSSPLINARLANPLEKDLAAIDREDLDALVESSLLSKVAAGDLTYYKKPIDPAVVDFYRQLRKALSDYLTTLYADRTQSAWHLVDAFAKELWPLQLNASELRFSDVTYVLQKLVRQQNLDLEYRLDAEVQHLLLDEFQDTSPAQWQILRPFAQRLFDPPKRGTFFCVGDRKQAIYGWRGGVSEIFDVVQAELAEHLESAPPLVTSYRSSPVVIDTVNQVFQNLEKVGLEREPDGSVLRTWQQEFPRHTTDKTTLRGYVKVEIPESREDAGSPKERVIERTVEAIAALHREAPHVTIGVLVGSHAEIAEILNRLHLLGIPASEEGGNSLEDSAAVNVLLAVLKLADHPQDGLARFLVSHTPLGDYFGMQPEHSENQETNRAAAQRLSWIIRRSLLAEGYGKTLERLADILDSSCTPRERRRLDQLLEVAYEYQEPWTMRTGHFIEQIRRDKVLEPSAANIRVMTVHAAKGLEFDAVIAPFFGRPGTWSNYQPHLVYARHHPAEPIDLVHLYCGAEERQFLPPRIQSLFDDHREAEIRERICVLYVWMTRAIHHLHLVLPPNTKRGQAGLASLVFSTLAQADSPAEGVLYETGDPAWHRTPVAPAVPSGPAPDLETFYRGYSGQSPTPSEDKRVHDEQRPLGKRSTVSLDRRPVSSRSAKRDSSVAMEIEADLLPLLKFCLQGIDWIETFPTEGKVRRWLRAAGHSESALVRAWMGLGSLKQRPQFRQLFERRLAQDAVARDRLPAAYPLFDPLMLDVYRSPPWNLGESGLAGGPLAEDHPDRVVLMYEGDRLFAAELVYLHAEILPARGFQGLHERFRSLATQTIPPLGEQLQIASPQISARVYSLTLDECLTVVEPAKISRKKR